MKVHRDILAGLLACTTSARGKNPVYANIGVSGDGKKLYSADATILAIGDCDGFEELRGSVLDGICLAQILRDTRTLRQQYIHFEVDWDTRDGKPGLTIAVPRVFYDTAGRVVGDMAAVPVHILHEKQFPDPTGIITGHPFSVEDAKFAVTGPQLLRVAKIMKPLGVSYIIPGKTKNTSWWAIGRAMTTEKPSPELRLLVAPVHAAWWPE